MSPVKKSSQGITGYLQMYNDWSRLEVSLRSLEHHLEEIVVVDGAYDWMKEFAKGIGWDPERSEREVYVILDKVGIPYRVIHGTWANQLEKRIAGYNACKTRYALRIDADEVLSFDDQNLSDFIQGGHAIASMYMHLHITPAYVIVHGSDQGRIAVQPVLFDKEQISAEAHLNYIFLVLPADSLPEPGQSQFPVFPSPVASCSHLSSLRHPRSGVFRGCYYYLNWMRANEVGWIPRLRGRPLTDPADLFREVSPDAFRDIMLGTHFVVGLPDPNRRDFALRHSSTLVPSELSLEKQNAIQLSFEEYLSSLSELNAQLVHGRHFQRYEALILDATTESSVQAIAPMGTLALECDEDVESVEAKTISIYHQQPWERSRPLYSVANLQRIEIDLSSLGPLEEAEVRRTVSIRIKPRSSSIVSKVRLVSVSPRDFSLDSGV